MSINLLNIVCKRILFVVSHPEVELDGDSRKIFEEKIKGIVAQALDPNTSASIEQKFRLNDLGAPRNQCLTTRILSSILEDCPDIDSKACLILNLACKNLRIGFTVESDPKKEGRARAYVRAKEDELYRKPPLSFRTLPLKELTRIKGWLLRDVICKTFREELEWHRRPFFSECVQAIDFLSTIFEEALRESKNIDDFFNIFNAKWNVKIHREMVTRDDFKELIGSLDQNNDKIQRLLEAYESNSWIEGEREIEIPNISKAEDGKFTPILNELFELPQFLSAMNTYFESL